MQQHMMALSYAQHRDGAWAANAPLHFAAQHIAAPVVFSELSRCIGQFPLAFIDAGGQMQLVAVLGCQPGRCDYVHPVNGKWLAEYVPSWLRTYPFALRPNAQQPGEQVLCIDEAALCNAQHSEAHPLFNSAGGLHPRTEEAVAHVKQHQQHAEATANVVAQLAKAEVLVPWKAAITVAGNTLSLGGLYRADEARLRALDEATLQNLAESGALGVAYAQLYSQTQLERLEKRAQLHHDAQHQPLAAGARSLDALFNDNDDELRFNFDD